MPRLASAFEGRNAMTSVTDEEIETVWPGSTAQTTASDDADQGDAPATDDAGKDDAPATDDAGKDDAPATDDADRDDAPPTDAPGQDSAPDAVDDPPFIDESDRP